MSGSRFPQKTLESKCALVAALCVGLAGVGVPAGAQQRQQQAPKAPKAPATRPEAPGAVVVDGLISFRAQNRPLISVLEEISRAARIAIQRGRGLPNDRVSFDIRNMPVDQALRQILAGYDTFFFYAPEEEGEAWLQAVWVYPKGEGVGLAPVPPEDWASTEELQGDLRSQNPDTRGRAIETIIARRGNDAREIVLKALTDSNDDVRTRALYQANTSGVEIPESTLAGLALGDPSSNVRFLALDALAGMNAASLRAAAQQAAHDQNEHVRNLANEILQQLEAAQRPGASQPRQPRPSVPRPPQSQRP